MQLSPVKNWAYLLILIFTFTTVPSVSADHPVAEVSILSYCSFLDSVGQYHVLGEVQNTGEVNVELVKVSATFCDGGNAFWERISSIQK